MSGIFNRKLAAVLSGRTELIYHPEHPRLFEDDYGMNEDRWETLPWIDVINSEGYSEPGCALGRAGVIVTANWNEDKTACILTSFVDSEFDPREPDKLLTVAAALEVLGVNLEWSDMWIECSSCRKLVQTSPDSYGWKRSYIDVKDEVICCNCVRKDPEELLPLLGTLSALTFDGVPLSQLGLIKLEQDFEYGMHGGQNARPALIAKALRARGVDRFLFVLDSVGQFDCDFSVWVDEEQMPQKELQQLPANETDGSDVAENIKRALQEHVVLPTGPGETLYVRIDSDTGNYSSKVVKTEELPEAFNEP